MQAFRNNAPLKLILALLAAGCGPQGQVQRTIHPAQHLTDKPLQDPGKSSSSFQRTHSGLPAQCRYETRGKDHFCLSCDGGGVDVERCYGFHGVFDHASNCVYSVESIKCLNAKPPFALNIAMKGSLEKTLVENTRLWQDSLRSIVQPGLAPDLQIALEKGLEQTDQLVRILVRSGKTPAWINEHYADAGLELKKSLGELQKEKESGHLKLIQVLRVSRALLEASGTPVALLSYWEALSVEGLEDPGE